MNDAQKIANLERLVRELRNEIDELKASRPVVERVGGALFIGGVPRDAFEGPMFTREVPERESDEPREQWASYGTQEDWDYDGVIPSPGDIDAKYEDTRFAING